MTTIAKTLCASAVLICAGLSSHAQSGTTDQASTTDQGETHTSDFRTFEPSGEEWETFRSAGDITQEGGKAVYNAVCAGCHMPMGQGAVGAGIYPALADNALLGAPSYPIYLILNGQKAMPPLGGLLDDQQIADVVNYIRSSFGNDFIDEYGEATAADVGETRP